MKFSWVLALTFIGWPLHAATGDSTTVVFGSCLRHDAASPLWDILRAQKPDLFIFSGDIIYPDTANLEDMQFHYQRLADHPGFSRFRFTCPVVGTWDDHDYGVDDGGIEFTKKTETKVLLLDFLREPKDSPRRTRAGVYDARIMGEPGRLVQVILLDTRSFRGPLQHRTRSAPEWRGPYVPDQDDRNTILGEEQWQWLEAQLKVPVAVRLLVSSIQVLPMDHGWEKWGNFPHERERLLELLRQDRVTRTILLSGDRHFGEISRKPGRPAFYEITSSPLKGPIGGHPEEKNRYRLGEAVRENNFGVVQIDWTQSPPTISLALKNERGEEQVRTNVP